MRLIDADALKEELAKNITIGTFNVSYDGILAEIIDNAPTVSIKSCRECPFVADEEVDVSKLERMRGKEE